MFWMIYHRKILQDYYCDLSSIQCMLYEDFANKTKEQVKYVDNEYTKSKWKSCSWSCI